MGFPKCEITLNVERVIPTPTYNDIAIKKKFQLEIEGELRTGILNFQYKNGIKLNVIVLCIEEPK